MIAGTKIDNACSTTRDPPELATQSRPIEPRQVEYVQERRAARQARAEATAVKPGR
jgi:hypothetical protein